MGEYLSIPLLAFDPNEDALTFSLSTSYGDRIENSTLIVDTSTSHDFTVFVSDGQLQDFQKVSVRIN